MSTLRQILISIVTSCITAAIIGLVGKKILERYIDYIMMKRELSEESLLKSKQSASDALFNRGLSVYPEVVEVLYRCKNLARACLNEQSYSRAALSEYYRCTVHLSENIYKYRIFFPEETFRRIHRFKGLTQEFYVLLNEVTRSPQVDDSPVDPKIQELAKNQMKETFKGINELYEVIIPEIQNTIKSETIRGMS